MSFSLSTRANSMLLGPASNVCWLMSIATTCGRRFLNQFKPQIPMWLHQRSQSLLLCLPPFGISVWVMLVSQLLLSWRVRSRFLLVKFPKLVLIPPASFVSKGSPPSSLSLFLNLEPLDLLSSFIPMSVVPKMFPTLMVPSILSLSLTTILVSLTLT